jgi:hypothetical protein
LPRSVLAMDLRVIKHWIGRFYPSRELAQGFLIRLEEHVDDRDYLPGNATDDLASARILAGSLIETALDGNEALLDLPPFAVLELDRLPDHQVHGLFHLPLATRRQFSTIKRRSRLGNLWHPPKIGLEVRGMLEIGTSANAGDDGGGLSGANPWDASRCNSSSLRSESCLVFPRTSCSIERLVVARAAGVGKRLRMARAVGEFGSFRMCVNSGKSSSQMAVSLFLRCVLSAISSCRC